MRILIVALNLTVLALLLISIFAPPEGSHLLLIAVSAAVALTVFEVFAQPGKKLTKPTLSAASATQQSATAVAKPQQADAEVISFLAALQEKGRLVDFLMDDVTGYDDAQVGAAARVVHEGCRAALDEVFKIVPVTESAEGTTISVPEPHRADEYRLTGKLTGAAPFNGKVVHRGWRTTTTKLPQIVVPDGELPCIAPAEIEVG